MNDVFKNIDPPNYDYPNSCRSCCRFDRLLDMCRRYPDAYITEDGVCDDYSL